LFPFETTGISGAEEGHRWTEGNVATFKIPLFKEKEPIVRVVFKNTWGLVYPHAKQTVKILVNNVPYGNPLEYTSANNLQDIEIDIPHNLPGDYVVVTLELPDARIPDNGDPRILAIALKEIELLTRQNVDTQKSLLDKQAQAAADAILAAQAAQAAAAQAAAQAAQAAQAAAAQAAAQAAWAESRYRMEQRCRELAAQAAQNQYRQALLAEDLRRRNSSNPNYSRVVFGPVNGKFG
jgi:hypothetical protein